MIEYCNGSPYYIFKYHVYDESSNSNIFFIDYLDNTMRYDLNYVEGWDSLVRISDNRYNIYLDDTLITDEVIVYIGEYISIRPFLFVEYEEYILHAEIVDLSYFGLSASIEYVDLLDVFDNYENQIPDILAIYSLDENQSNNRSLFDEKIINSDDSDVIPLGI